MIPPGESFILNLPAEKALFTLSKVKQERGSVKEEEFYCEKPLTLDQMLTYGISNFIFVNLRFKPLVITADDSFGHKSRLFALPFSQGSGRGAGGEGYSYGKKD